MNRLSLLPRNARIWGLLLVIPSFIVFMLDPDIAFGEGSLFTSADYFKTKVPALFHLGTFNQDGFKLISWIENDLSNEILLSIMLLGSYFIAFARIREEDEFSYHLRLEAMTTALIVNGMILFLANWFFYDIMFLYIMIVQLFSFLILFSLLFALKIRKHRKGLTDEE